MHGDVNHYMGANGFGEGKLLGKADIIDPLIPCHSQRRIDQSQMSQCSIFLRPVCMLWWFGCEGSQRSGDDKNNNFLRSH
jgi:hypothetical protein